MSSLDNFIAERVVLNTKDPCIVFAQYIGDDIQKFSVKISDLETFLTTYSDAAAKDVDNEGFAETGNQSGINICEPIVDTCPVMFNFLFKYSLDEDINGYNENIISNIVSKIQTHLISRLEFGFKLEEVFCVFLKSRSWIHDKYKWNKIRFHFPYTRVKTDLLEEINVEIIGILNEGNLLEKLNPSPIGKWENFLIPLGKSLPMYRSKQNSYEFPLMVNKLYGNLNQSQNNLTPHLESLVCPQKHMIFGNGGIKSDFLNKHSPSHWLPIFLSLNFYGKINEVKNTIPSPPKSDVNIETNGLDVTSSDPIIMFDILYPLIDITRFHREDHWISLGKILNNIHKGSEKGLFKWFDLGREIERETNETNDAIIYQEFSNAVPLTIKTLAWFAREDNPVLYKKWHNMWCKKAMDDAINCVHSSSALMLYRKLWLDYVFCNKLWYRYSCNRLKPVKSDVFIQNDIDEIIVPLYNQYRSEIALQLSEGVDNKNLQNKLDQVNEYIKKLGNVPFRSSIISLASNKFYVDDLEKYKDSDPAKMAWENGVSVGGTSDCHFRPGMLEDYITMSTRRSFSILNQDHPLVKELMTWLMHCFPDVDLLGYFLKDAASQLIGINNEKIFRVWSGEGDNSKSMIIKLFQHVLGDYCIDFPAQMLCRSQNNSGGLDPSLAQARSTHMAIIAEPDEGDQIQAGKLKRFTGNDRFFARMCGENGGNIVATFKLVYMCNNIPLIKGADKAVYNRFLILPFLSTWSANAPADYADQLRSRIFPQDPTFELRIPHLATAFAWVMSTYFVNYRKEKLIPPKIVMEYTKRHWENVDIYNNYLTDNVIYDRDSEAEGRNLDQILGAQDLYPSFKIWYKDSFPSDSAIPTLPTFKREISLNNRLGSPSSKYGKWVGIQLIDKSQ